MDLINEIPEKNDGEVEIFGEVPKKRRKFRWILTALTLAFPISKWPESFASFVIFHVILQWDVIVH